MKKLLIFLVFWFFLSNLAFAQTPTNEDEPVLAVSSPQENEQIFGSKIQVSFIVRNFIFTNPAVRTKNQKGEGHLNVWLDEENPTGENAQEITRAAEFSLEGVKEGRHQLILELVNNDGTSLKPPVRKIINFTTIAQKEVTGSVSNSDEENEINVKKKQQMTYISSSLTIALLVITLIAVSGLFIFNRFLNK